MRVGYHTAMEQLLEWAPLIVFFVAFKVFDIFTATAALMAVCVAVMLLHRWRTGRFKAMQVATALVAVGLGTATLVFRDPRFIQWKPTVLLGLAALAFVGSGFVGRRTLACRMFEAVFKEPLDLERPRWLLLNTAWATWFALLAVANIYIARHFAEAVWVDFKVFGITAAMLIFMIPQVIWLSSKTSTAREGRAGAG